MLHIYLRKEYETNEQFKNLLDELQIEYRKKIGSVLYGLGKDQQSDEFLNEVLSNTAFRAHLKLTDKVSSRDCGYL